MRPSEFEAIRSHLQEAIDDIERYLIRQQEIDVETPILWVAAGAGLLPIANLHTLTDGELTEFSRSFCSNPLIEDAYPWRHSSAQAAVLLRNVGRTLEADQINEVLSKIPTGPIDSIDADNMARQFDAIRVGAERIKRLLTACLTGSAESPDTGTGRKAKGMAWLKAERLAAYLGFRLVPDPDAVPPEPTPEKLARPTLTKTKTRAKAKRKAN